MNTTNVVSLGQVVYPVVAIALDAHESAPIQTNGLSLCGILMPAAFTGSAITFEAALTEGGTYYPIYNASGVVSYTVAPSEYVAIDPKDFYGVQFLKIVSGSAEAAARSLNCSLKGI